MIPQIIVSVALTLELVGTIRRNPYSEISRKIGYILGSLTWTSIVVISLHVGGFW